MFADVICADLQRPSAEVISGGVEVIEQLANEWRSLCEGSHYDEPFYRPEWIAAYVRAFTPDKTVMVATARSGGRLIAVLPLVREAVFIGGIVARKLRAAGNVHTCRFDLVHRNDVRESAVAAIWDALRSTPGWDVLELSNVPIDGAAGDLVRLARAQGNAAHVTRGITSPYLSLPSGDGSFENLVNRLDPKFRSNLRRRLRKLQARGPVHLISTSRADENLARFYALERSGWKGTDQSAVVCNAATRQFYDEVAEQAQSRGYLCLHALECAGRAVAMYYGLRCGARYYLLKTTYDESVRECSPGQVITHEVLRALTADRCGEFDFLGLHTDWKRAWAPRLRPHANWYVFRGPIGHLVHQLRFKLGGAIGRRLRSWTYNGAAAPSDTSAGEQSGTRAFHS
jgi:CelD/BcsL family acetyltransferase involved in cellulose biosynthesis